MGSPGRPRKQQPHRPGAPLPIPAAGCGSERRRAAAAPPKRAATPLRLTLGNGYRQDDIAIWRHRRKKGSEDTVIDERQYIAGRRIEHLIQTIMTHRGLKSFDMTVPVVDSSFVHRLGGYGPEMRNALVQFERLSGRIGPRDLEFLMSFLGGMGIHGAMLHEAGLEWRCPPDRDIDQTTCTVDPKTGKIDLKTGDSDVGQAPGILPAGNPKVSPLKGHRITDAEGFLTVEDRRLVANKRAAIAVALVALQNDWDDADADGEEQDERHDANDDDDEDEDEDEEGEWDVPNDDGVERQRRVVRRMEDHVDEAARSKNPLVRAGAKAFKYLDDLEVPLSKESKRDPSDLGASVDAVIDIGDIEHFHPWTTVDRAKEVFTTRQIELASLRCRSLLSDAADFFDADDAQHDDTTAVIPVLQISAPDDIPFDVEIIREYEPVEASR